MYSLQELADKLKVHKNTVRNWIKEKKLGAIKIGGQIRITEEQLKAFLDKGAR